MWYHVVWWWQASILWRHLLPAPSLSHVYETSCRHMPEHHSLPIHHCESFKAQTQNTKLTSPKSEVPHGKRIHHSNEPQGHTHWKTESFAAFPWLLHLTNVLGTKTRPSHCFHKWFIWRILWLTCAGIVWLVQRLAMGWTVQGSNPSGSELFCTCQDWLWGLPSLLYDG
jgi:hypothetical protein